MLFKGMLISALKAFVISFGAALATLAATADLSTPAGWKALGVAAVAAGIKGIWKGFEISKALSAGG